MADKTIFQKIIDGDIPAEFAYKDNLCVALNDINPQAPVHLLIIPRQCIARLGEADEQDQGLLGHLLLVAAKLADTLKLGGGYRLVINNGPDGGESVPHLHVHLLGGRSMTWPPG